MNLMYNNEIQRTKQSLSATELNGVLDELGIDVPDDLKKHYLASNGGIPKRNLFQQGRSIHILQEFLPVKYASRGFRFEDTVRNLKLERNVLPEHLIPFAVDPGGDYFCISNRREDFGHIFIYRGESRSDRACQWLAKSIRDFIEQMVSEDDLDAEDMK
jgi:hypothetical protein